MKQKKSSDNKNQKTAWYFRWWGIVSLIVVSIGIMVLVLIGGKTIFFGGRTASEVKALTDTGLTIDEIFRSRQYTVSDPDNPWAGAKDFSVEIVEFVDYQSQLSQQILSTVRDVVSEYHNVVKYIHRDFPDQYDKDGILLAEIARCANDQDRFWVTRDRLLITQGEQDIDSLINQVSASVGLDVDALKKCLDSDKHISDIENDYTAGIAAGVRGTPTFFFNGYKVEGVLSQNDFYEILDALLPGYREYYDEIINPEINDNIPELIPAE